LKANLFLSLVFCTFSVVCLADKGGPSSAFRFSSISVTQILQDSIPENREAGAKKTEEKKEEGIKEVPKARKQVKPLALDQVPDIKKTEIKSVIKPVVKPVVKPLIKPVIKPVIKPAIRIQ